MKTIFVILILRYCYSDSRLLNKNSINRLTDQVIIISNRWQRKGWAKVNIRPFRQVTLRFSHVENNLSVTIAKKGSNPNEIFECTSILTQKKSLSKPLFTYHIFFQILIRLIRLRIAQSYSEVHFFKQTDIINVWIVTNLI